MLSNSQRRVPESHDCIADVFVNSSFLTDDRVRERSKQPVHERCEALRVILVQLGNGGEASHVAEKNGHLALFPPPHALLRGLRPLLRAGGGTILAQVRARLAAP